MKDSMIRMVLEAIEGLSQSQEEALRYLYDLEVFRTSNRRPPKNPNTYYALARRGLIDTPPGNVVLTDKGREMVRGLKK